MDAANAISSRSGRLTQRTGGGVRWFVQANFVRANVVALLLIAIWFRLVGLDHLPGVNGDEAWYGVQAERVVHGEAIAWRTPTGNLLNPLFFGPQVLLHAIVEPSFSMLRSVAAVSGILALAMNYWLCRGVFGRRKATISTLILAVLPANIAYSRIAWDASQSLLVSLPVICWSLRAVREKQRSFRYIALAIAALGIAIIVHPTNVFLGPIVAACAFRAMRADWEANHPKLVGLAARPTSRLWVGAFVSIGAAAVCWKGSLAGVVTRVTAGHEYAAFLSNLTGFIAGDGVLDYFAGSDPSGRLNVVWRLLILAVILGASVGAICVTRRRDRPALRMLTIGVAMSLAAFFLIAGANAIDPNFQRYAIWMIAPIALLVAAGIEGWMRIGGSAARVLTIASIASGWLLLAAFQVGLVSLLERTGGQSHLTYRTALVEPKLAAMEYIVAHSAGDRLITIEAREWWNYWPLKYLAYRSGAIHRIVVIGDDSDPLMKEAGGLERDSAIGGVKWFVEFASSRRAAELRRDSALSESTITDAAGRPLLSLFHSVAASPNSLQPTAFGRQSENFSKPNLTTGGVDIGFR